MIAEHSDVKFPVGTTYIVVFDTDAYSGNFERELGGYACGAYNGLYPGDNHGWDEKVEFEKDCPELAASLSKKLVSLHHIEYGPVQTSIRSTPVRRNDGHGKCYDSEGAEGYPAYESVAVFFKRPPTPEEMKAIRVRAHEFSQTFTKYRSGFSIKDIYLVTRVVSVSEERLDA